MSRFFRSFTPFLRSMGNASKSAPVAFAVAAAVPNNKDAPDYVQDVFKEFESTYEHHVNDTYQKQTGLDHLEHSHVTQVESHEAAESTSSDSISSQTEALNMVQQALMDQNEEQMTSEEEETKMQKMESALKEMKQTLESIPVPVNSTESTTTTECCSSNTAKAEVTELKEADIIAAPSNTSLYLAEFIDHTVLKPKSTEQDIIKMCTEAKEYNFFSVCCNPCWVPKCKELLVDSNVKICSVVGFPLGANTTEIKVMEAIHAVHDGADVESFPFGISY